MSNYTILVVEDESIVALNIKKILEHLHHKVLGPVASGEAAIELAVSQNPDLILMDIKLHGKLDGIEAAAIIKKTTNIPIIFVTAISDEKTLQRSIISDPYGYIVKPFDKKELKTAIEMAIYKSQSEKRLRQSEIKYRTLIERMNEGVVQMDNDTVILFVNERFCEMTGYSNQELIGNKFNEILLFDSKKDFLTEKNSGRNKIKSDRYDLELKKKNESKLWVEVSSSSTSDDYGKVIGSINIFLDISEKKKNENIASHLAAIVESSTDSIFSKTLEGNIISWNNSARLMYGYSSEEIIGKHISILVPPDKLEELSGLMIKLKDGESVSNFETIRIKKNKEKIYVSLTLSPIKNAEGNITAISTIGHNIDTQKRAEESVRISEQKYKNFFEYAPVGIYTSDFEGKILSANSAFAEILGCSSIEESLNLNLLEDIYFDKEIRAKLIKNFENTGSVADVDVQWRKRNGELIWVQLNFHSIKDSKDHSLYFEGFVRDITKPKKSEEQILKLSRAVQQSPVSIIILDVRGNVEYINSKFSQVTGYSSEEIKTSRPNLLLTQMLSLPEKRVIWDTIISGHEWKGEFQHNSKDNKLIWESASVSPIINEEGNTTHYLAIFQDITERKMQEEQLIIEKEKAEKSDRLKTEFLSQMSHEVRTPLNNILTYTSLLREEFEDKLPVGMESAFNVINSSSKRLIRTIELILNLSRIQTGNFDADFKVLDLDKDLLEDLTLEFYSRANFKNLSFIYENIANNTLIKGDQYSLGQIFVNLIDNAIKYTDKGEIKITIHEKDNKIIVSVSDTGIGISKEFLPKIFEPFMQEDSGRHRNIEGTGLGLALAEKYIDINNAEISVVSDKGKGSTFNVTFTPAAKDEIT